MPLDPYDDGRKLTPPLPFRFPHWDERLARGYPPENRVTTRQEWWPIRLGWSRPLRRGGRSPWFTWHGWQVGWDGMERRVFGWTLHLGRLKVMFGKDRRPYHPREAKS